MRHEPRQPHPQRPRRPGVGGRIPGAIHILTHLVRLGPLTPAELPRRWPLTRVHLKYLLGELEERGLVERIGPGRIPGRPRFRATAAGARMIRGDAGSRSSAA